MYKLTKLVFLSICMTIIASCCNKNCSCVTESEEVDSTYVPDSVIIDSLKMVDTITVVQ